MMKVTSLEGECIMSKILKVKHNNVSQVESMSNVPVLVDEIVVAMIRGRVVVDVNASLT